MDKLNNITKKKWILDFNKVFFLWHSINTPVILDFEDNSVCLNFSNNILPYKISDNTLFIGENIKYKILEINDQQLILSSGEEMNYFQSLGKGKFNIGDEDLLKTIIQSKGWNLFEASTKFNEFFIEIYNDLQEFVRGGIYFISYFNKNLLLIINIDGEIQSKVYLIKSFNRSKISLMPFNEESLIELV